MLNFNKSGVVAVANGVDRNEHYVIGSERWEGRSWILYVACVPLIEIPVIGICVNTIIIKS